mgnify:CR=1 FL=1
MSAGTTQTGTGPTLAGAAGSARLLEITQCRECTYCGELMDNYWQPSGAYCRKTGKKMDPFGEIPDFCPLPPNAV